MPILRISVALSLAAVSVTTCGSGAVRHTAAEAAGTAAAKTTTAGAPPVNAMRPNKRRSPTGHRANTPVPERNCIAKPSACGYPDATTTGYKHTNVQLSRVPVNSDGDFVITKPGVVDAKHIEGCVLVRARNVTIKRSLISGCRSYFNIRLMTGSANFRLEDVEVDGNDFNGQNAALVDDGAGPVTVLRMDMHHVADGPHPGEDVLIEDSYIHDLYGCQICHNDTIQSAGARNVVLRHNTLVNHASGRNAVVRIATEQGPVNQFLMENNLLSGGNYAVQVREQGNGAPEGVVIRNNRIVRDQRFGPFDFIPDNVSRSGNIWDDDLTEVK